MNIEKFHSSFGIKFSQVMEIEDDGGDITVMFPETSHFIKGIEQKQNAEKLHLMLKRM